MREYLFNADIYKERNRISKNELVEMIITGKPKTIKYFDREDELTKDDAIELLKKIICLQTLKDIYSFYQYLNKYMQKMI